MKTYFEVVEGKNYRELTAVEKEMIQERQTALVILWQDETDPLRKLKIEDEIYASFEGLIKAMAYRQAERSFSVDEEEFQGIISLALAETMVTFDRTLGKPVQPVFIIKVRNDLKMMYRQKGYDLHDTSERMDRFHKWDGNTSSEDDTTAYVDIHANHVTFVEDLETQISTDEIIAGLFGDDEVKRTVIHMFLNQFKRSEIVSAINVQGKSPETVAKQVTRTINSFKERYSQLTQLALV